VLEIPRLRPPVSPPSATMAGEEGDRSLYPWAVLLRLVSSPSSHPSVPGSKGRRTGSGTGHGQAPEQDMITHRNRTRTGRGQDMNRTFTHKAHSHHLRRLAPLAGHSWLLAAAPTPPPTPQQLRSGKAPKRHGGPRRHGDPIDQAASAVPSYRNSVALRVSVASV